MSVVFLGYHEMGCMALRTLLEREVDVAAVFTYEDDPRENCWFGSVAEIARAADIPTHTTERINDPEWAEYIAGLAPDLLLSVHYRHMVGKRIRGIPRLGAFNLHGSLLPKYRGRAPLNWQVVHGERRCGITLHHMVRRADAGDVVDQQAVDLGPDETAMDLYRKLLVAGRRVLERQLPGLLAGTAPRTPQDESQATLFGGRTPEDGRIDWHAPARRIHDLVRAVSEPWPGAFCDTRSGRVTIWQTRVEADAPPLAPGEIAAGAGGEPLVGTGRGALALLRFEAAPAVKLEPGASLLPEAAAAETARAEEEKNETKGGAA